MATITIFEIAIAKVHMERRDCQCSVCTKVRAEMKAREQNGGQATGRNARP